MINLDLLTLLQAQTNIQQRYQSLQHYESLSMHLMPGRISYVFLMENTFDDVEISATEYKTFR